MVDRPKSYVMLSDFKIEPHAKKGTVVYPLRGYDYGLADDDTRLTGVEHVSVTLDPTGDYPGFTVPKSILEPAP